MARLSDKVLAEWLEQMADGLEAGVQPSDAVALARELGSGVSYGIAEGFGRGYEWRLVLEDWLPELGRAEKALIVSASQTARLPECLRSVADSLRRSIRMRRQLLLAMAYPFILLHLAAFAFAVGDLIESGTKGFLLSGSFVIAPVWALLLLGLAAKELCPSALKAAACLLPVFSGYLRYRQAGVLCEVLAAAVRSGMPLDQAWRLAGEASGSDGFRRLGDSVSAAVGEGEKASAALVADGRCLPSGFLQLYQSGEETGSLDRNLEAAASRYLKTASGRLALASVLYPKVIALLVASFVAYKVLAFFAGYFKTLSEMAL